MPNLEQYTLAQVHAQVLASDNKDDAIRRLGLSSRHFYLSPYSLKDAPLLSYAFLKRTSVEEFCTSPYGAIYNSPMVARRVNLEEFTLAEIHAIIRKSTSLTDAARQLNVLPQYLATHLANATPEHGRYLDFNFLKETSPKALRAYPNYGSIYDRPLIAKKIELNALPLGHIHLVIRNSTSLTDAAYRLGSHPRDLARYLARGRLDYDFLKSKSPEELAADPHYAAMYNKPLTPQKVDLKTLTLADLHQVILANSSLQSASVALGIDREKLSTYIGSFSQPGTLLLTYEYLKATSAATLRADPSYGAIYDKRIARKKITLWNITLSNIHQIILQSTSLSDAAVQLGVTRYSLMSHLTMLSLGGEFLLSYERLQIMSADTLRHDPYYGAIYNTRLAPRTTGLADLPLTFIHKVILDNPSFIQTTRKLGTSPSALENELSRRSLPGTLLSFDVLKSKSPEEVASYSAASSHPPAHSIPMPVSSDEGGASSLTLTSASAYGESLPHSIAGRKRGRTSEEDGTNDVEDTSRDTTGFSRYNLFAENSGRAKVPEVREKAREDVALNEARPS